MKKALVLWSLLLVLALLAGCGSQTADNGNDTPNNDAVTDSQDNVPADNAPVDGPANTPADSAPVDYPALFERARISDGAASEDVAIQLVKAYDSDAAGLLSAMRNTRRRMWSFWRGCWSTASPTAIWTPSGRISGSGWRRMTRCWRRWSRPSTDTTATKREAANKA